MTDTQLVVPAPPPPSPGAVAEATRKLRTRAKRPKRAGFSAPKAPQEKKPLPAAFVARMWKPGESGNPGGFGAALSRTQSIARAHSPEAVERLVELMRCDDPRVATVACNSILDRAFGRPREMPEKPPQEVLADMTDEQLAEHTATLLERGGMPRATAWKFVKRALQLDPDG